MTTFKKYTNSNEPCVQQNQSNRTVNEFQTNKQTKIKFLGGGERDSTFKMIEKTGTKNALIKFNVSKNEIFQLNENYKTVHRKLKMQYNVEL